MFNWPNAIIEVAQENNIDLRGTVLFFYEVYELQFDSGKWTHFEPEPSFPTDVNLPDAKAFEGVARSLKSRLVRKGGLTCADQAS